MNGFFDEIDRRAFMLYESEGEENEFGELLPVILERKYPELYLDRISRATTDYPLLFTNFPDSAKIKAIAIKYPENFIVLEQYIVNRAQLREYIKKIIVKTLKSELKEFTLAELKMYLIDDFSKLFTLRPNVFTEIEDEVLIHEILVTCSELDYEYKLDEESLKKDLDLKSLTSEFDKLTFRFVSIRKVPLERVCKRIFLRNNEVKMKFDDLIWEIQRIPENIIELEKNENSSFYDPITILKNTLNKLSEFSYSYFDDTILLRDFQYKEIYKLLSEKSETSNSNYGNGASNLVEHNIQLNIKQISSPEPDKENELKLTDQSVQNKAGLLGVVFHQDRFLIENADEYVKIRPLVFVKYSYDFLKDINSYLTPSEKSWSELHDIIYAFLFNEKSAKKNKFQLVGAWIKENLEFNAVICPNEKGLKLVEEIIWAYPPVFNYSDNPFNIVKATIEAQLRKIHGK